MSTPTTAIAAAPPSKSAPAPIDRAQSPAAPAAPTSVLNLTTSKRELLRWMFQFLKPVKGMAAVCSVLLAIAIGLEVCAVYMTGNAINHMPKLQPVEYRDYWRWVFSSASDVAMFRWIILSLVGLTVGILVLRYVREVANNKLSMDMVFYLREAIYDKLQRVGFKFHDAISSGQLISRALTDLQNVRAFVQTSLLASLDIILNVGAYMVLIATRSPLMAGLSLIPLPFWTWYILRFGKRMQPASKAVMEAGDKNIQLITENIAGVHVVKAFATEKQEVDKYNVNCNNYFSRTMSAVTLWANFTPIIRAIGTASHLSLFLAASILIIKGYLQIGDILILGAAMGVILGKLQMVSAINEQYQNAIVSAQRLYEILMAPPAVPEKPDAPPLPKGPGRVTFDNVAFGYDPAKPVVNNLSFEVPGGTIVAIVGPTGAGKTTLVNLISRFYDPQAGSILIDGMDLRDTRLNDVRSQVAFVFQETYLFSDTVAGNIAYGRPKVDIGEIEAAARLAQAHEFIENLPQGYQTMLGERGTSLSGGQKQRLAIARAIVSNPRILVLDDATASVDPETEDLIRRGMNFVMQDRTTFVIAHRISTVKRAGMVIVIEHGRVTQVGTHAQLMEQDGHYREIAAVQLYGDDVAQTSEGLPASHMDRMLKHAPIKPAAPAPAATVPAPVAANVVSGK